MVITDSINLELPVNSQYNDIRPCGVSYWTRTAEVRTVQKDGHPKSFFLKVVNLFFRVLLQLIDQQSGYAE